jgi:MFS family permease
MTSQVAAAPAGVQLAYLVYALTAGHTLGSMAMLVMPAVAPDVARDYGVDPSLIGYQISLVTVGLMVSLLFFGNLGRKLGACRTNQIGHLCIAASMLLMVIPSPALAVAGSVGIGVGYGFLAPSASALLVQFTPVEQRNMAFSIQQTGVPFGGMLAALIAPAIAVAFGWRWALVLTALLLVLAVFVMQRGRACWDRGREPRASAVALNPFNTLAMIWRDRRLRYMALVGSCFSWGQFVVASYTVVACVTALGMSLIAAGTVLTVVQVGNAGGRVLAGWIADRIGGTTRVLRWIIWLMLAGSIAAFWLSPVWPLPLVYLLFTVLGIATGAWAGMVLAEIGRRAPATHVSTAISGALVYTNIGKFVGPIAFANVYLATRSYAIAFASLAVPAVAALYLLSRMNPRQAQTSAARNARTADATPGGDAPSRATHISRGP